MNRWLHRCGVAASLVAAPALADDDLCGCLIGKSNLLTPGTATCEVVGASTIVSLTDNTVIEWDSFALRPGADLQFNFTNPADTVVNRVTGTGVTFVGGTIGSNGNVVLLAPNSFLAFGDTARVTAGGFTASGLDADSAQFLQSSAQIDFHATPKTAATTVIQGEIATTRGGVTLVGRELHVVGRIDAAGPVTALTGNQVTLDVATPRASTVSGDRQIIQGGTVDAAGDITFISQNAISMTGRLSAGDGRGRVFVKVNEGGNILTGAAGLEVRASRVDFSEIPQGEVAFIKPEEGDDAGALAPAFNEFPSRHAGRGGDRTVPTSSTVVARTGSGFSQEDERKVRQPESRAVAGNVGSVRKRSFFQTRTTVTPKR
jgi:filamentous hemagglutinin family protein